ncbi:MAG: GTP-sensing pleiotropic transcriptional regulator CodY [Bacillota bacterium]|jgi:transcriptional pleiotropic repressor|nr:GTP-sensing pleiotropic transcriptional regulator CodY [Bacillota bacterium]HHT89404.1 GTP-sensing pleiotropic transcriptional regulator CodY [Bacillota bacterium]
MLDRMKQYLQSLQQITADVDFDELSDALRLSMDDSSVYVLGRKGKLIGYALEDGFDSTPFDSDWLYSGAASSNIQSFANRVADISVQKGPNGESVMVAPIIGGDERVGSILFVRRSGDFSSQDIDIAHIASVTLGMIISRVIHERQEDKASQSRAARSAINSLSYSEILAMQRIFEELNGDEGLLVASRIADEAEITRSVIVNALRKLASANVIESRSLGMKGTYLRVLNPEIRKEFEKQWYSQLR